MNLPAVLFVWALLCVGVAALAASRGRSALGFFLLSFLLLPLLGLVAVLVTRNVAQEAEEAARRLREQDQRETRAAREHEQQMQALRALVPAPMPANSQPAAAAPAASIAQEIEQLLSLRERGALTQAEFDEQKQRVLARSR